VLALRRAQASAPRSAAAAVDHVARAVRNVRYERLGRLALGLAAHVHSLARAVEPTANQNADPAVAPDVEAIISELREKFGDE
jgi:hypothetical protein